ncbi:unnamed protein product [Miscanthus lutarioriparius]|uniref:Glycosyltransferase n=1 Tax=Miscanthus lutarioriparius TaxID=422564 RepID=A0A811QHN8_9POAL|nr:unnamed protein product [Miscanthus lutarioriparius]
MDAASPPPLRIVIFPWLAFGHMLPYLELAERLATRGHRVFFVSTPRNISRLRPVAPGLARRLIDFVALPFPRLHGLPDGTEATSDVPAGKLDLFYKAFDGLAAPFSAFLDVACAADADHDHNKVDLLMVDSFHYWAAAAAAEHDVPCVLSLIFSATTLAQFGVPRVSLPPVAADAMPPSIPQRFALTFEKCKLVACRSCVELEPESMALLSSIFGKPVIPFGLLPPSLPIPVEGHRGVNGDNGKTALPLCWLDSQKPKSAVFVALGSEPPITVEQLHELALGLELAGAPFLWALKGPTGISEADDILPPGFVERTRGRGLVAMGWVPQLDVLVHGAVGAFLTHCGWSSVVEGLVFGQPMIMLPFLDEQGINARLMETKQVGVQVPRFGEDRSFSREGVARSIGAVMSEEEGGRVLAANAKKMQKIVVGDEKCQERYMDDFIRFIRTHKD